MKKDVKTSTVFIRGIPPTAKDKNLQDAFDEFGKIRQAFVTKAQNASGALIGYVKFTSIEEASKAIDSMPSVLGKKVTLTYARKKPRKFRTPQVVVEKKGSDSGLSDTDDDNDTAVPKVQKPQKPKSKPAQKPQPSPQKSKSTPKLVTDNYLTENGVELPRNDQTIYIKNLPASLTDKDVRKKCRKIGKISKIMMDGNSAAVTFEDKESANTAIKKLNNHVFKQQVISVMSSQITDRAIKKFTTPSRVIIRNLSFKVTEEILRSQLTKFGNIVDLSVPMKEDGKIKGFAFVSFINKFEANKAIQTLNGKEILSRKVAVDWAVAKDQYQNAKAKETVVDDDISDEASDENEELSDSEVKDEDYVSEPEDGDEASGSEDESKPPPPKRQYDDVKEGKTIFMGNLPFDIEKEDIEETFSVFGDIRYVRMVYDHDKDRPKGIAFLQFKEKHDTDSCLERHKVNPISIGGRTLAVSKAVDKNDANIEKLTGKSSAESKGKNNRNLHLAMEGVIKEGTNAANGVSKTDMMKRKLALEAKKKKLKNVNFFVSTTRLCVRNMPPKVTETELKNILTKYGHVKQVKIMRDIKQANSDGIGKSKGYGFVEFAKHEAAISALRNVNNNPNVFSAAKRPIVDFAIENGSILTARGKQGTNKNVREVTQTKDSQKKSFNQRWKDNREKRKVEKPISTETKEITAKESATPQKIKKKSKKKTAKKVSSPVKSENESNTAQDTIPSNNKKRSAKGPSERPMKKQKRDKAKNDEAKFQKLVESYKSKLTSDEPTRTFKKWYED